MRFWGQTHPLPSGEPTFSLINLWLWFMEVGLQAHALESDTQVPIRAPPLCTLHFALCSALTNHLTFCASEMEQWQHLLCNVAVEAEMRSLAPMQQSQWQREVTVSLFIRECMRWDTFCNCPVGDFDTLKRNKKGDRAKEIYSGNYLQLPNLFIFIFLDDAVWKRGIPKANLPFLTCKSWKQD